MAFLDPLQIVWMSMLLLIILFIPVLKVSTTAENMVADGVEDRDADNWDAAWETILGATCQQGSPVNHRSVSARIVVFLVFLSLMFLHTRWATGECGGGKEGRR